jgi:hypothetical protein
VDVSEMGEKIVDCAANRTLVCPGHVLATKPSTASSENKRETLWNVIMLGILKCF